MDAQEARFSGGIMILLFLVIILVGFCLVLALAKVYVPVYVQGTVTAVFSQLNQTPCAPMP